jgi:hypothetical protein
MSNLKVTSHTPTINATGVYRNETIRIFFDRPIQPNTVNWDTISMHDKSSYITVVGNLGTEWTSSGTVIEATFTPQKNLLPNTEYVVYVFEKPNSIIALDGSQIQSTYSWEFTTGLETYDESTASGSVPSGTIPSSGTGIDLSGVPNYLESDISKFYVYSTDPKNQEPNVETQLGGVYITFAGNVQTSAEDLAKYITVDETPVLQ